MLGIYLRVSPVASARAERPKENIANVDVKLESEIIEKINKIYNLQPDPAR